MKPKMIFRKKNVVVALSAFIAYVLIKITLANWDEIKAFIAALFS